MRSAAGAEAGGGDGAPAGADTPEVLLPEDDARALRRFVEWSLGAGFKLCVVEVAGRRRERLLRWALAAVPGARQVRLDRANEVPIREVIQEAVGARGELSLLVLTHLEAAEDRRRVCAQLNVQRDELVVAFAVPWLVLVSPPAALALQQDAPDFSDFVGLWLADRVPANEEPELVMSRGDLGGNEIPQQGELGTASDASEPLDRAIRAIDQGRLEEARDLLAQYDLRRAGAPESPTGLIVRGDLHVAEGDGWSAVDLYEQAIDLAQRLADAEPARLDLQVEHSIALDRLGDLYLELGDADEARRLLEQSLGIAQRIAEMEPTRAEHQRELSISLERLGDLHRALGNDVDALQFFERSLEIRRRLAEADPARSKLRRDLSATLNMLGDLHRALGNSAEARDLFEQSVHIRKRLADEEPARAGFRRDLSYSLEKLGDLQRALGNGAEARQLFEQSLEIRKHLADAEPDRAMRQLDLSASLNKLGDLERALGNSAEARRLFEESLDIRKRLADAEPARADLQRGLSYSLARLAGVDPSNAALLDRALDIRRRLLALAPEQALLRRELAITLAQRGEARDDPRDLREALELLRALQGEGKLEAPYAPWIDRLAARLAD